MDAGAFIKIVPSLGTKVLANVCSDSSGCWKAANSTWARSGELRRREWLLRSSRSWEAARSIVWRHMGKEGELK